MSIITMIEHDSKKCMKMMWKNSKIDDWNETLKLNEYEKIKKLMQQQNYYEIAKWFIWN